MVTPNLRPSMLRRVRDLSPRCYAATLKGRPGEVVVQTCAFACERELAVRARVVSSALPPLVGKGATAAGEPFVVRELVRGVTLDEILDDGPGMAASELIEIARLAAWGLAQLHDGGIVHGALSPRHLLWTHRGDVALLGLGGRGLDPARPLEPPEAAYAEPDGPAPPDVQSDLWAFGRILSRLGEQLLSPGTLDAWEARATAKDRAARFPSAIALADAFVAAARESRGGKGSGESLRTVIGRVAALLGRGEVRAAATLLRTHLDDLLDADLEDDLQALVRSAPYAELHAFRLVIAAEFGDPESLRGLGPPMTGEPEERLAWALVLALRGDIAGAAAELGSLTGPLSPADAFERDLLLARCRANQGNLEECLAALPRTRAPSPGARTLLSAFRAAALAGLGRRDEALREIGRALRSLGSAGGRHKRRAALSLAHSLESLGRPREALAMLDAADILTSLRSRCRTTAAQRGLYVHACLLHETGQLERSLIALDELAPQCPPGTLHHPYILYARAQVLFAMGRLDDMEALFPWIQADRTASAELQLAFDTLRRQTAVLRRRSPDLAPRNHPRAVQYAQLDRLAELSAMNRVSKLSAEERREVFARVDEATHVSVARKLLAAEVLLTEGARADALAYTHQALAEAAGQGYAVREAEAHQTACEVLWADGQTAALAKEAHVLADVGNRIGSQRFVWNARLFSAVAQRSSAYVSELAKVAEAGGVAPDAAARAMALLGEPAPLDPVDRELLRHAATAEFTASRTSEVGHTWEINEASQEVWVPGSGKVDLRSRPLLFRLLLAIADRPQGASKEELTLSVWGDRVYHPLRHDNRLHAAVRKLRIALGDEGARQLVVRTDAGYVAGGHLRRAKR